MGTQDTGLTLEGLAHKLERQTHRLETLERENTELRSKVATLESSETRRGKAADLGGSGARRDGEWASGFEGRVSRRSLLSKTGAAALAAVTAGTFLYPPREAKAVHFGDDIESDYITTHKLLALADNQISFNPIEGRNTHNSAAAVRAENSGSGPGVRALGGTGVWGSSALEGHSGVYGQHTASGSGVVGDGGGGYAGVLGRNPTGTGVRGEGSTSAEVAGVRGLGKTGVWGSSVASGYSGVYGQHTGSGYGVVGDGRGSGSTGVLGRNPSGTGVRGESSTVGHAAVLGKHSNAGFDAIGVKGETVGGVGVKGTGKNGVVGESPTLGHAAVYGQHTGSAGVGVVGDGTGSEAGVLGRSPGGGTGVQGEGVHGVKGKATGGYGGQFEGGKAQLRLVPLGTTGKPTTGNHAKGEISMDSAATLWVCTVGGNPGMWRKVATTAN